MEGTHENNSKSRGVEVFERVVEQQIAGITEELTGLKTETERLEREIVELSGVPSL